MKFFLILITFILICIGCGENNQANSTIILSDEKFTITSSSGENGTIYPLGDLSLEKGSNKNYIMIPNLGYKVASLIIDDAPSKPEDKFKFSNISKHHKIKVLFEPCEVFSIGNIEANDLGKMIGLSLSERFAFGIRKNGQLFFLGEDIKYKNTRNEFLSSTSDDKKELKLIDYQKNIPNNLKGVLKVETIEFIAISLNSDSSVILWDIRNGKPVYPFELNNVKDIALGKNFLSVLYRNGTLSIYQFSNYSFLKDPIIFDAPLNIVGVKEISACNDRILILMNDGSLMNWDYNRIMIKNPPIPIDLFIENSEIVAIAAGRIHSLILLSNGEVIECSTFSIKSNKPKELNDVIAIAAGNYHSVALKRDGTVCAWEIIFNQENFRIKLKESDQLPEADIPKNLPLVKAIAAKGSTTLFLFDELKKGPKETKKAFKIKATSIGEGHIYPLGNINLIEGEDINFNFTANFGYMLESLNVDSKFQEPNKSFTFSNVNSDHEVQATFKLKSNLIIGGGDNCDESTECVKIVQYNKNVLGLTKDGSVKILSYENGIKNILPADLKNIVDLEIYNNYVVALKDDGNVVSWVLGNTNYKLIEGLSSVISIAAGGGIIKGLQTDASTNTKGGFGLALKKDGTIFGWYANGSPVDVPDKLDFVKALSVKEKKVLLLMTDGSIKEWFIDEPKKVKSITLISDVKSIAAGVLQNLALKEDGTVVEWVGTEYSHTIPNNITGVIAIATGLRFSLALKKDGMVVMWPCMYHYNDQFISELPKSLPIIKGIAGGGNGFSFIVDRSREGLNEPSSAKLEQKIENEQAEKITISSSAGENGEIYPNGETEIRKNGNINFIFNPKLGYTVKSIIIDGEIMPPDLNYEFKKIKNAHKIHVNFKPKSIMSIGENILDNVNGAKLISVNKNGIAVLDNNNTLLTWQKGSFTTTNAFMDNNQIMSFCLTNNGPIALTNNGVLIDWKYQYSPIPSELNGIVAIVSGDRAYAAIKNNGKVFQIIRKDECDYVANLRGVLDLAYGYYNIALKYDGSIIKWGEYSKSKPFLPEGLTGIVSISAGGYHFLALKEDGNVVAWGENNKGQTSVPLDLNDVVAISAGQYHSVALKSDGTIICWGDNSFKQCDVPKHLPPIKRIYANGNTTVFSFENGIDTPQVRRYQSNNKKTNQIDSTKKFIITSSSSINGDIYPKGELSYSSGQKASYMFIPKIGYVVESIKVDSKLITLTDAYIFNEINDKHTIEVSFKKAKALSLGAIEIDPEAKLIDIVVGKDQIIGLNEFHSLLFWGPKRSNTTDLIINTTFVSAIAACENRFIALNNKGIIQFDNSSKIHTGLPTITSIATGVDHSLVLLSNGQVMAWESEYTPNVLQDINNVISIAAGRDFSAVLLNNGTIKCWGKNNSIINTIPPKTTDIIGIAAGKNNLIFIKKDKSIEVYGDNTYGQLKIPKSVENVISVAAGDGHIVALKSDGSVIAWGFNNYGQSTIPDGLPEVKSIAAGGFTTALIFKE